MLDLPPEGQERHAMVAINSCIHLIGGMNKINENGTTYTSSLVLTYALNSSKWAVVFHVPVYYSYCSGSQNVPVGLGEHKGREHIPGTVRGHAYWLWLHVWVTCPQQRRDHLRRVGYRKSAADVGRFPSVWASRKNLKLTKISGDYQNCILYDISFQQLSTC